MKIQNSIMCSSNGMNEFPIPLPLMTDYKWQYMALQDRLQHPEKYREIGEDVEAAINRLKHWLTTYTAKITQNSA